MPAEITFDLKPEYLYIRGEGGIDSIEDERTLADSCYSIIQKHSAKSFLIDLRDVEYKTDPLSKYLVVEHFEAEYPKDVKKLRGALVVKRDQHKLHKFWEEIAIGKGFCWYIFTNIDAASAFLLGPS